MAYQPISSGEEGNRKEVLTSDDDVRSLLFKILKEMKIMNLHLQSMTDEVINNNDI